MGQTGKMLARDTSLLVLRQSYKEAADPTGPLSTATVCSQRVVGEE